MTTALVAELTRLGRRRTLVPAALATAVYAAFVSWVLIAVAGPTGTAASIPVLEQAGGGTRPVAVASTFSSVLVLAVFTGLTAGDHTRGIWRAALLQHPRRLSLSFGTYAARVLLMWGLVVVLFAAGWATALLAAPAYDIDTSAWLSAESWGVAASDLARVLVFALGWSLLGTALGTLTRSVPVGLAVGVLWAGPIENAIGAGLDPAERWFPGLLLRQLVTGVSDLSTAQLAGTLGAYALIALAATALVVQRRDVTA